MQPRLKKLNDDGTINLEDIFIECKIVQFERHQCLLQKKLN
jgi:hypothetical protein